MVTELLIDMTAEEFLKSKKYPSYTNDGGYGTVYVTEAMIEFAKLHVEAALKEASEEATINKNKGEVIARTFGNVINGTYSVNKQSILNSYSLDNIK